jgi:hypothetical protein
MFCFQLADTAMTVYGEFIYRPTTLPNGSVFIGLSPVITMFGSHNGVVEQCIFLLCVERVGASMVECFACRYVIFSSPSLQKRFLNWRALLLIIVVGKFKHDYHRHFPQKNPFFMNIRKSAVNACSS